MIRKLLPNNKNFVSDFDIKDSIHHAIKLLSEEIDSGIKQNNDPGGIIIVCGTAFMMADARAAVGIVEPKDGDILSTVGFKSSDAQVQ